MGRLTPKTNPTTTKELTMGYRDLRTFDDYLNDVDTDLRNALDDDANEIDGIDREHGTVDLQDALDDLCTRQSITGLESDYYHMYQEDALESIGIAIYDPDVRVELGDLGFGLKDLESPCIVDTMIRYAAFWDVAEDVIRAWAAHHDFRVISD